MKTTSTAPLHSWPFTAPITVLFSVFLLLTGCVSSKYRSAPEDTPPPQLLNAAFASTPLQGTLNTVITYNGPGSWKRNAYWDEYVVTFHNPGHQPLTVTSVSLMDFSGTVRTAGDNPWVLEKESKTLEQKYKDAGIAFVRYTVPGVILAGVGVGLAEASLMSAGAAGAATVCLLALPVYYTSVIVINHHNKGAMEKEFHRRRLTLPLSLAPRETHAGSFFFPMVPSPRSLGVDWSNSSERGEAVLPLPFLQGLHLKAPVNTAR